MDVRCADHTFPVRIVSDSGLSDEAEVAGGKLWKGPAGDRP